MQCKIKGCSGSIIDEDVGSICNACGTVQGSSTEFIEKSFSTHVSKGQSPWYVQHHMKNGTKKAYNTFVKLYDSMTLKLGTNFMITEQGQQMLPKLWDNIKQKQNKKKKDMLSAMLFLLYNQGSYSLTVRQFQKKLCLDYTKFSSCIEYVRKIFDFPSNDGHEIENSISDHILALSKLSIKKSDNALQNNIFKLAQRLANTIHAKNWVIETNKSYVENLSSTSVFIASQYFISEMKDKKCKSGKLVSVRYGQVDLLSISKYVQVTKRTMYAWLKPIQEFLYKVAEEMPIRPGCVTKYKEVGKVLVDILDYLDLDLDHHIDVDEEMIDLEYIKKKDALVAELYSFITNKKQITNHYSKTNKELKTALTNSVATPKNESQRTQNLEIANEDDSQIEISSSVIKIQSEDYDVTFNSFNKHIKLNWNTIMEKHDIEDEITIDKKRKSILIGSHAFYSFHIDLLRELIEAGCSLEELKAGKYSLMVKQYLEGKNQGDDDDSDLDESDDDINEYIRSPKEVEEVVKMRKKMKMYNDV